MRRARAAILFALMLITVFFSAISAGAEETEAPTETPNNVFVNILKKGSVEVTKTAEDDLIEGIKFRLYGTSDSGQEVDIYATTDKNGKILFENIPIGTYVLSESSVSDKYIIPEDMEVAVTYNEITKVTFTNILKEGSVQLVKTDSKNPDVKLSGAEFVIYRDKDGVPGELVGYMREESKGVYTYRNLPYGKYFVNEIKAPEGYTLDPEFYSFEINSEDMITVENKDGFFINEKIPQPTTTTTQPTSPPDAPKTGEISNVVPLLIIIALSAGVIIFLIIIRKRRRR